MMRFATQATLLVLSAFMLQFLGAQVWRALMSPAVLEIARAPDVVKASPRNQAKAEGLALNLPTLSSYPETAARPVFFEGRQYPAKVDAQLPTPLKTPASITTADGFKLLGVTIAEGTETALIAFAAEQPQWVGTGDVVQSWTVNAIDSNEVSLTRNGQLATLSLYTKITQ